MKGKDYFCKKQSAMGSALTQLPQQFTSNGKATFIGFLLVGLTLTALIYNIVESHKHIQAIKQGR